MELTVLGCSGQYGSPAGGACSGYLVRAGDAVIWMDCGNGSFANLQQHIDPGRPHRGRHHARARRSLRRHLRPARAVPYGLERRGLPVYAPEGLEKVLEGLVGDVGRHVRLARSSATATAPRSATPQLQFSRTDHPLPTVGGRARARRQAARVHRRHRAGWSVDAFGPGADLVLSEATYHARRHPRADPSLGPSGRRAARAAKARRLMLTHLWPTLDPVASVEEGSEAFGHAVTLAAPHLSHPRLDPGRHSSRRDRRRRTRLTTRASGRAADDLRERHVRARLHRDGRRVRCSSSSGARACCAPRRSKSASRRG